MKNSTLNTDHATSVGEKISEGIDAGERFASNLADDTSEKLKQGYGMVKAKAQDLGDEVNGWVQKRPLLALGAALGTGLLVGRLLNRATHKRNKQ